MKNVLDFLWKHNFFLFFLILETFSVFLLIRYNDFHRTEYQNSFNQVAGKVHIISNSISQYFGLKDVNEQLAQQNVELLNQSVNAWMMLDTAFDQKWDTVYKQHYQFTQAKVVKNSNHQSNNYLLINKGSYDGVTGNMGVISPGGVVGVVIDVSKNFAAVLSVLNKKTKISARIKSNGQLGSVAWVGMNFREAILEDIPSHAKIQQGDTIVTSGNSSIFPEGIPIGVIKEYELEEGQSFYKIYINFIVDYNALGQVYVIKNLFREEQGSLIKDVEEKLND